MATATQTPAQPAQPQVESNVTQDRTDYVVGWLTKNEKGEDIPKTEWMFPISSDEDSNIAKKAIEENRFQESFRVTTAIPRAKNLAGIKEICPDEEEAAMNFNRGAKQKANNRLKAKLLDVNEDGAFTFNPETDLQNGILDMTSEIASPSKRKVLGEEEKLDRFLEQFPEALRNAMKTAYLAQRSQPQQQEVLSA